MEEVIKIINELQNHLNKKINLNDLIPPKFKNNKNMIKTGNAGIFAGSLELAKEGDLKIKQDKIFGDIFIRNNE